MKVLDQLLNVIGSGISDPWELKEDLKRIQPELTMADVEKYVTGRPLFAGYTEENVRRTTFGEGEDAQEFIMPEGNEKVYVTSEEEKANHPNVVYWLESTNTYKFSPYPNFKEEYSTVWQCKDALHLLDDSFIQGALDFYIYCQEFMNDPERVGNYSSAFPKPEKEADDWGETTESLTKDLHRFLKDDKYKTNQDITDAYGVEFRGSVDSDADLYDFQVRRWEKEKARIDRFLNKTITLLGGVLEQRKNKLETNNA